MARPRPTRYPKPASVAAGLLLAACPVVGDGELGEAQREIDGPLRALEVFDGLRVAAQVTPEAAEGARLDLRGDTNLLDLVVAERHSEDVLSLGMWTTVETEPTLEMTATIVTPRLERLFVGDWARLTVGGDFGAGATLAVRAREHGEVEVELAAAASVIVDVDHQSRAIFLGSAVVLEVELVGDGRVDAGALEVEEATVLHRGAGILRVCAHGALRGELAGSGVIEVVCPPAILEVVVSGEGELRGAGLDP